MKKRGQQGSMGMSITPVLTHLEVERIHQQRLDLMETVGIDY